MKKRSICILTALLLILPGCALRKGAAPEGTPYPIYFLAAPGTTPGGDALKCSEEYLDVSRQDTPEAQARAVIQRLLTGSADASLLSPFPDGTRLISLRLMSSRVYVDLTGISRLEGIDLILADYCLSLSLTSIEGIDNVLITCDSRLLPQQPRRVFQQQDVLFSTDGSLLQPLEVTLYYPNKDNVLTAEPRTLDIYEGETQCGVLITALLAGPKDSSLTQIFPEDFVISSVRVENGICRINIPSASLQALPADETMQHLMLWSIAESLYSLDYINEIRLMTDGAELDRFGSVPVSSIAERPRG